MRYTTHGTSGCTSHSKDELLPVLFTSIVTGMWVRILVVARARDALLLLFTQWYKRVHVRVEDDIKNPLGRYSYP